MVQERVSGGAVVRVIALLLLLASCGSPTEPEEPCVERESGVIEHPDSSLTSSVVICG